MRTFETKDSGQREEYASGMHRDLEAGKPRFDLLIPEGVPYEQQMLTRFARLMERGAGKYTARNWEKASGKEEMGRFRSSALRHMMQWVMGEDDEDHAAAVFFNIMGAEALAYKMSRSEFPKEEVVVGVTQSFRELVGPLLTPQQRGDWEPC